MQIGLSISVAAPPTTGGASEPALGTPSFAYQNTTVTNDLAADGYSWANARPLRVDKHGNRLTLAQRNNGGTKKHFWVWKNAAGWVDNASLTGGASAGEAFMERGTFDYDPVNDRLYTLWITSNPGDGGVIIRAYDIVYSGNNISAINRTASYSVVLDGSNVADAYQHPCLLFLDDAAYGDYGALLAVWSARKTTNEIRAAMVVQDDDGLAGGTAANWVAPVTAAVDTLSAAPDVASYSALVANATGAIPYPSIGRKASGTHVNDIYLAYHNGAVVGSAQWRWRRLRWNSGANDWSTGLTADALVSNVQRAGTDTGYELKQQLGTFIHEDTANDRMAFGLATWKSNTDGDTFGFAMISAADAISLVDVYSAAETHSFAPVGDIAYDTTHNRIVVSYLTTDDEFAGMRLYDGATPTSDPVVAYDDVTPAGVDIPLLNTETASVLMLFRDRVDQADAPLYRGLFGSIPWV
jgi:hypothetical protein